MGWALSYRYSLEKSVPRIRDLSDILAEMQSSLTAYSNVGMFQYYINFTKCYAHTYCVRQPRKTSSLTTTKELLPYCLSAKPNLAVCLVKSVYWFFSKKAEQLFCHFVSLLEILCKCFCLPEQSQW